MSLPEFNQFGDLPDQLHRATLSEAISRFGSTSASRVVLALRLQRIHALAAATGFLRRFVVFGSFVTSKSEPNDVDVFMIMDDNFDVGALAGDSQLLFEHTTAQAYFGCSVFWVRQLAAFGGEERAIFDWQIKRDGTRRGIVEIVGV